MVAITGNSATEYSNESTRRINALCLTIAQIFGDRIVDEAVIVGGLVPSLAYAEVAPAPDVGPHVGTADLDFAMKLVILDKERYEALAKGLLDNGFTPGKKENGQITRQRWVSKSGEEIDFLFPPVPPDMKGGAIQSLTKELAPFTMMGLDLALAHPAIIELSGADLEGRAITRLLPICRADIFVALKALAIAGRKKAKDAYDIHYVLKHDPIGSRVLGAQLAALQPHMAITTAVHVLQRDYKDINSRGPRDVCDFLERSADEELAADALAHVIDFLTAFDVEVSFR